MTPCKEKKKAAEETATGTPAPSAAAVGPQASHHLEVAAPAQKKPAAGVTTDLPAVKDPEAEKRASLMQLALQRNLLLEVPFGLYCM